MRNFYRIALLSVAVMFSACRKEEALSVDFTGFNPDNPASNTPLDQWLKSSFLDAYNIDVVYRYNRYYHGNTANVTPVKTENVQPTMQMVLDGFISPYRKIAGETFTKKYMPKEWVLFGSYAYSNTNDPGVAGTAAAGRRITLYGVNDYRALPAGQFYAWDRQRIMHHEFGHILNQIIPIPPDFEPISRGLYKQPYEQTPTDSARRNGFVTSYASGVSTEDYAETISYLLINGQVWYNDWANFANTAGKARFVQKQNNVMNYFNNLGIDFKALQMDVQKYMIGIGLNETKFAYWLSKARTAPGPNMNNLPTFKSLTINPSSDYNIKYGGSAVFNALYNRVKAAILARGFTLNFLRINFRTPTLMYIEADFSAGTSTYQSYYGFNMATTVSSGEVDFTTGTPPAGTTDVRWLGNADFLRNEMQPMLDYINNNIFVADFLPANVAPADYMSSAGFSILGAPTDYFYGPLAY